MAELVARELDVAEDQLEPIRHAAELHDVGKVGIPDAILTKPSKLDKDEWGFMRRHTIIGERIMAGAPALAQVSRLVRASHERWDGAGYPDGLKGEEIPDRRADHQRSATPSTPWCPTAPTRPGAAPVPRWPNSGAAGARSSIRPRSRPSASPSATSWPPPASGAEADRLITA